MTTVREPQGRMTKPLSTPFEVGDVVLLVADLQREALEDGRSPDEAPRVGDVGRIREIFVSDPKDGDVTFLMFSVKWKEFGRRLSVGADEIVSHADAEAWLRRQLAGLQIGEA